MSVCSILSHKFQVFLDNLGDGYYTIDSDALSTELFNHCNTLEIKHHKKEQFLARESVSFAFVNARSGRGRELTNLPINSSLTIA